VSELETIREALKTADWRELRVVESQEANAALDALAARLKAAEQALRNLLDDMGVVDIDPRFDYVEAQITRTVLADARAALARQPSQEQVVPCDQHDAGHQAGWA
jgi:hypothetical protein